MNIRYDDSFSKANSLTHYHIVDPFGRLKEFERDLRQRYGSDKDPERPPKRGPGDKYILIGGAIGLITGGASGAVIGGLCFGFLGGVLGFIVGFFGGGIIGVIIGDSIRKRRSGLKDWRDNIPH